MSRACGEISTFIDTSTDRSGDSLRAQRCDHFGERYGLSSIDLIERSIDRGVERFAVQIAQVVWFSDARKECMSDLHTL
jgi:hypothetical protein